MTRVKFFRLEILSGKVTECCVYVSQDARRVKSNTQAEAINASIKANTVVVFPRLAAAEKYMASAGWSRRRPKPVAGVHVGGVYDGAGHEAAGLKLPGSHAAAALPSLACSS